MHFKENTYGKITAANTNLGELRRFVDQSQTVAGLAVIYAFYRGLQTQKLQQDGGCIGLTVLVSLIPITTHLQSAHNLLTGRLWLL